mmetsp:Transcript_57590/g.114323  ORF Transcript_57590/g.114323 Transcript_57590/m.114323 type:complete len:88 (-) Transcript_57590:1358-1621(-)
MPSRGCGERELFTLRSYAGLRGSGPELPHCEPGDALLEQLREQLLELLRGRNCIPLSALPGTSDEPAGNHSRSSSFSIVEVDDTAPE